MASATVKGLARVQNGSVAPPVPFPATLGTPYRLVTLWDIVNLLDGDELVSLWSNLLDLWMGFDMTGHSAVELEEARTKLGRVAKLCHDFGWSSLGDQASRLLKRAEDGERGPVMSALADDLRLGIEDGLGRLRLVALDERDHPYFENATLKLCRSALRPEFSSSEEELNLAGKALALGLSTASVSHAMRSVEASLHVLARLLGIGFGTPVELQDWAVLTQKIQAEIDKQQKLPRGESKSEKQQTLAQLVLNADHFRLAWRNHVQHAREKYEDEEARKVLAHVGDYLKILSDTA